MIRAEAVRSSGGKVIIFRMLEDISSGEDDLSNNIYEGNKVI